MRNKQHSRDLRPFLVPLITLCSPLWDTMYLNVQYDFSCELLFLFVYPHPLNLVQMSSDDLCLFGGQPKAIACRRPKFYAIVSQVFEGHVCVAQGSCTNFTTIDTN